MTHPRATTGFLHRLVRMRQTVWRVTATAVVAVIVLEVLGLAAWWALARWRLGRIELTNDGAPMTVQVLDESGERPLGEPFDVIKKATLSLPDGDYRLRVTGVGRLGRTARFAVNRGETIAHELSLDEGRLLGQERAGPPFGGGPLHREQPIPFATTTVALELTPGKADIIEVGRRSVVRRDGKTGEVVWDASKPTKNGEPSRDPAAWLQFLLGSRQSETLLETAPDLNGDGTGDLVWSFSRWPALFALSGKDGSLLWTYWAEPDGPGGPRPEGPKPLEKSRPGTVVGEPATADVDGDGKPDLIATFSFAELPAEAARRVVGGTQGGIEASRTPLFRRIVVAISGRSGRWLWTGPSEPIIASYQHPSSEWPAAIAQGRNRAVVSVLGGERWFGLDPATGRTRAGPIELGFVPVRPLQHADLDGDGVPEVLALGRGLEAGQQTLAAFSAATRRQLWAATVNEKYELPQVPGTSPPSWPWWIDLDGDGRTEVIVPDSGPMPPGAGYRGLRAIDGLTGRTRWVRPMRPETWVDDGLAQLIEAPDLDGDGTLDLIAASRFDGRDPLASPPAGRLEARRIYVDAISGRDGRALWFWHLELPDDRPAEIRAPRWWGRGPDGWPLLAVPIGGPPYQGPSSPAFQPPVVHNLEASTGREVHAIEGLMRPVAADLDGDGLPDLWGEVDRELRAFRGEPPEIWRTLGSCHAPGRYFGSHDRILRPAPDLDGDGIPDTVNTNLIALGGADKKTIGTRTVIARSGRDGHLLWKSRVDPGGIWSDRDVGESYFLECFPLPAGDLDGDGTPDLVVRRHLPLYHVGRRPATIPLDILSGRTGQQLGSPGPLPLDIAATGDARVTSVEVRVIEPGARPDILVRHGDAFAKAGAGALPPYTNRDRLTRLSGRDGRLVWDIPLNAGDTRNQGDIPHDGFGDLDGDGSLDLVAVVEPTAARGQSGSELIALSLHRGLPLWSHPIEFETKSRGVNPPLSVADLDGDGRAEVVVAEKRTLSGRHEFIMEILDGRDGKPRWSWSSGVEVDQKKPVHGDMHLADLDGTGQRRICLAYGDPAGVRHIVVFDPGGRELARSDLSVDHILGLGAADLTGDGRDELLVTSGFRLLVLSPDLKDLWSWPFGMSQRGMFVPAASGNPGRVIVHPAVALDGSDGHPLWAAQAPLILHNSFYPYLIDPEASTRLPRIISGSIGSNSCRLVLPTTSRGTLAPPRGTPVPPGLARDDPRWNRPLPWTAPILRTIGPSGFLAMSGLALVNMAVPMAILWLVARRRPWTIRLLLAIPVAAAVPLWVFQSRESLLPAQIGTLPIFSPRVFVLGTLAGLPIVLLAGVAAASLVRRRWKTLAALVGLSLVGTAIIGAAWLWSDRRSMPAIEHYDRTNVYLVVVPGLYAAGLLLLTGRTLRKTVRWLRRPVRREISD